MLATPTATQVNMRWQIPFLNMKMIDISRELHSRAKKQFIAIQYLSILLVMTFVTGCNNDTGKKDQSSVSVYGTGTVLVKPDMLRMNISLSKTASTTKSAQEEVSRMVRQALEVLGDFNIEDKNIVTASLTFSPEYEYRNGRRVLIGQTAQQAILFSMNDIQNDNEKVPQIIDRLVQINGIELNQIDFNVKNNTEYFIKSRELAFQKATEKAEQYASLSGLKVAKVLTISEEGSQQVLPINNRMVNQYSAMAEAAADAGSTILPSGELEITTKIQAVFLLE